MERTKYSFGDEQGRKGYLEEKYPNRNIRQLPNGKFSVNGVPVDPEGFDLGDIADVTDEIVRLGFQLKGASEGAAAGVAAGSPGALFGMIPMGTAGAIGGSAAGRASGQAAV